MRPTTLAPPATGLVFFAALVGNCIGWGTGVLSDHVVVFLARRNGGVKEPEMRLWMLIPCFVYAALGYMLYGWGSQAGIHWIGIAIAICAMIAHQVGACAIATAYAMESFPGVSLFLPKISSADSSTNLTRFRESLLLSWPCVLRW